MEPNDKQTIWDVMVDGDCIAHFRKQEKAVRFMMEYGDETWSCMTRTLFFCDEVDLRKVYDNVTVEIEGEWVQYTGSGPRYSETPEGCGIGPYIQATRNRFGWSLRDLANRCGVSYSTISRIENGDDFHFSALEKIAQALGMRSGDLLVAARHTEQCEISYYESSDLAHRSTLA